MIKIIEKETVANKINELVDLLLKSGFDFQNHTIEIGIEKNGFQATVDINEHIT